MAMMEPTPRPAVKVIQIGRKTKDGEDTFWLMCEDGECYRFDQDDAGLTLDVEAWASSSPHHEAPIDRPHRQDVG